MIIDRELFDQPVPSEGQDFPKGSYFLTSVIAEAGRDHDTAEIEAADLTKVRGTPFIPNRYLLKRTKLNSPKRGLAHSTS